MATFVKKYLTIILILFLVLCPVPAWVFPSVEAKSIVGIIFLLFSFFIAGAVIFEKHRELDRQGKTTRSVFIRNTTLEIAGTWLVMVLASVLGTYIAEIAESEVHGSPTQFITGITVSLLVGITMGVLPSQTWDRLVKLLSK